MEGYNSLLGVLEHLTPKLVLLSPPFAENLGRPLPDQVEHNRDVERYTAAIKTIAEQRHLPFVDMFHPLVEAKRANPDICLTHNGILLNESGYWIAAQEIEKQLGLRPEPVHLKVSGDGKVLEVQRREGRLQSSRPHWACTWKSLLQIFLAPPPPVRSPNSRPLPTRPRSYRWLAWLPVIGPGHRREIGGNRVGGPMEQRR